MAEFEKGTPVIWIEDDLEASYEVLGWAYHEPGVSKDTHGTYDDHDPESPIPWVRLDGGRRVVAKRSKIASLAQWEVDLLSDEPKFKVGDRVLITGDTENWDHRREGQEGEIVSFPEHCDGAVALVATDPSRRMWGTELNDARNVHVNDLRHVEEQSSDATPFDLSKVKAGDTVAVRIEEKYAHSEHPAYTITDTVAYEAPHGGPVMVGPFVLNQENITLLDHQPAPEPEPTYEPHTVYEDAVGTRFWSINGEHGVMFVDEHGDAEDPAYVTEPRPLVVIDPAGVDVDSIVNDLAGVLDRRTVVEFVLEHLGLAK